VDHEILRWVEWVLSGLEFGDDRAAVLAECAREMVNRCVSTHTLSLPVDVAREISRVCRKASQGLCNCS